MIVWKKHAINVVNVKNFLNLAKTKAEKMEFKLDVEIAIEHIMQCCIKIIPNDMFNLEKSLETEKTNGFKNSKRHINVLSVEIIDGMSLSFIIPGERTRQSVI